MQINTAKITKGKGHTSRILQTWTESQLQEYILRLLWLSGIYVLSKKLNFTEPQNQIKQVSVAAQLC